MKFIHALIVTLACSACTGYRYQPDNIVEEAVELGIQAGTGVDIDLSLSTPEKGFSPKALSPVVKVDVAPKK